MYLRVTDAAKERLQNISSKHDKKVALYYSRVQGGFACGIAGRLFLKLVPEMNGDLDTTINSDYGEVLVQSSHLEELAGNMKLDYKKEKNALLLYNDVGLIDGDLNVLDENDKRLY